MKKTKLYLAGITFLTLNLTMLSFNSQAQYSNLNLLNFNGSGNGGSPYGTLVSDGTYLYGMAEYGGTNNDGVIFKLKTDGTVDSVLLNFNGINGQNPQGALYYDGTTYLYGMTNLGGASNLGIIFKISTNGSVFDTLMSFSNLTGNSPQGSLISDGTFLYGMTYSGGAYGSGTIFKIMPDGTAFDTLMSFKNNMTGSNPQGSLYYDGTYLYGMTNGGGKYNTGTVFKIKTDGTGYVDLFDFNGTNGAYPQGSLVSDGTFLYGMTPNGGTAGYGNIFKVKTDGTGFTDLFDFNGTNGDYSSGSLYYDGTTFLYGMTLEGGMNTNGNIFRIKTDGTGFSDLFDFNSTTGNYPYGSLIFDGTFLYGMTSSGGASSVGTVFKFYPGCSAVTLTSATSTNTQTVCINTPITPITYQVNGTNVGITGLPTGVTSSFSGGVFTISGTPDTAGTFNYIITDTSGNASCSPDSSFANGSIIVDALPAATISASTSVCQNSSTPYITFSGSGSNGSSPYVFIYTINGGASQSIMTTVNNVSSDNVSFANNIGYPSSSASVQAPTDSAGTFIYSLDSVLISGSIGCASAQSDSDTVTVNPFPAILTSASGTNNQNVCMNTPITNITYQINGTNASVTGLPDSVKASFSGNVLTISGSPQNATGTYNYVVIVNGAAASCSADTNITSGTIIVNSSPTATISGSTTVCQNSKAPSITFTGYNGSNATLYTFIYNVNSGANQSITVSPGGDGGYVSSVSISAPTDSAGTFIYSLDSVTYIGSIGCATLQSGSDTITVNPFPAVLTSAMGSDNQNVCLNTPITNITYQINGTNASVIGLPDSVKASFSGNVLTISGSPQNATGTYSYLVTVNGTTASCYADSNITSGTIIVNSSPTATISGSTTVCQNSKMPSITFTGFNGSNATPYTFIYSINNGANQSIKPPSDGDGGYVNSASISVPTDSAGTFVYSLDSVMFIGSTGCATAPATTATVIVNPYPAVILTSASITDSQTICTGSPITNIIYQVTGSIDTVANLPKGVIDSLNGNVLTISGIANSAGIVNYSITVIGTASCTGDTSIATGIINVNSITTISLTSANGTDAQNLCLNTPITSIVYTVNGGGSADTITGLPPGVTYTFNSGVFTISGTPSVSGTFNYTVSVTGGSCVQSNPTGSITVNSLPSATISGNAVVCQNSGTAPILFTATGATAPYNFTYNLIIDSVNSGGNLTISSSAGSSSVTLPAPTTTKGTYEYSLVSVQDGSSNACSQAQSGIAIVTVNPLPTATISGTTEVCKGSPAPVISFTGVNATPPFTINYTINGVATHVVNNSAGGTLPVPVSTNIAGTYTYSLVSVQNGSNCSQAQSGTAVIKVDSLILAILTTNQSASCSGYLEAVVKGNAPPYTYVWQDSTGIDTPYRFKVCSGNYRVIVFDSACTDTAYAYIGGTTVSSKGANLSLSVSSNDAGSSAACDGKANVSVSGGKSPYSIYFSNNTIHNSSYQITNLCSGFYTVNVTDADSNKSSFTFVVGSPSTTYPTFNPAYKDSTVKDTLITNAVANCIINYGTIDSIKIKGYNHLGTDSVNVNWAIYQGGNTTNIQQAEYGHITGPGVYIVELDLYCTDRASGSVKAVEDIYFSEKALTGIETYNAPNIIIYPNPTSGIINLNMGQLENVTVNVYNMLGESIYQHTITSSITQIDLSAQPNGVYSLKLATPQGTIIKKIVISH